MVSKSISCNFLNEIDFLIIKTQTLQHNPGSRSYKKSITKLRKLYLNKWFSYFPGIHDPNGTFSFCDITTFELECQIEFRCLLFNINKSFIFNKNDLIEQLEASFDILAQNKNPDVFSIMLFLILMQNMESSKQERSRNFKEMTTVRSDTTIIGFGHKSLISDEGICDYVGIYPRYMSSSTYLPEISYSNTTIRSTSLDDSRPKFMTDLSELSSIKRSTFNTTSGYESNIETQPNHTDTTLKELVNDQAFAVSYPFSSFNNETKPNFWGDEFIEEWKAFQRGTELPRRFIWEDRGRNVGPEKPRVTEWNCPFSVGNGAICLALYESRYNPNFNEKLVNDILNAYSVPISSWIDELIMLRLGLPSLTFKWNETNNSFYLAVSPPRYLVEQFVPHLVTGTIYARLCLLANGKSGFSKSLIRDGLMIRLSNILKLHWEVFTTLNNNFSSILEFSVVLLSLTNQIQYLGDLFEVNPCVIESWPDHIPNSSPIKQGGIFTLKYLYETSFNMPIQEFVYINFYLLEGCLEIVLDQLYEWIYQGRLRDQLNLELTKDFLLFPDENYYNARDEKWWSSHFVLHDVALKPNSTWLFEDLSKEILRCGKSVNLLSLIHESNPFLCNSQIVKHRPLLRLCYTSEQTNKTFVKEYVRVVQSVAADLLKSQKEILEEKQNNFKLKLFEAQRKQEKFQKSMDDKLFHQRSEIQRRKNQEFDRLKQAADSERKRKMDSLKEEKRLDKQLVDKEEVKNRAIIDELKYDLTLQYSQKFADAEARERISLNRIKEFQLKLQESKKSNIGNEVATNNLKNIIEAVIEEVQQNVNVEEEQKDDRDTSVVKNIPELKGIVSVNSEIDPDNLHLTTPRNTHILNFEKVNTHGHTGDSTAEKYLYPDSHEHAIDGGNITQLQNANKHGHTSDSLAQKAMYPYSHAKGPEREDVINFQNINKHGHTSDSSAQREIYPDSHAKTLEGEDLTHFKNINTHGHTGDSTAEKYLYPDSHENAVYGENITQFQNANKHGHTSDSSAQREIYPDSHAKGPECEDVTNFQNINKYGHTSDSSAQKAMYPDSHSKGPESEDVTNFQNINKYGHTSDSSAQKAMYPDSHSKRPESEDVTNFQNINKHGHTSDSSAQKAMYPDSHAKRPESEDVTNFQNINKHGHTSDSSAQKAMYPDSYLSEIDRSGERFKSINTQGHASKSSIQNLMYPFKDRLESVQENNNSIIECSSLDKDSIVSMSQVNDIGRICKFFGTKLFNRLDRSASSAVQLSQESLDSTNQHPLTLEDETIDAILNRSLVAIIMTQVKLADSSIMSTIFARYKFREHLEELRNYFFLDDGNFSSLLLPAVFELISKSTSTKNMINRIHLLDILQSSLNCTHSDSECLCGNLCLSNNSSDIKFDNKLDNFSMSYTINWPINIVIHQKQIFQYQMVFRAIVQIKYSIWCINETRRIVRSWNLKSHQSSNGEFTPFYLCLQEMEHWVRSMDSSLGNQVSGSGADSWQQFVNKLNGGLIDNLDRLIESHATYLDWVVLRCVLAGDYTESITIASGAKRLRENIRKILIEMLGMCSKYHRLVNINYWQSGDSRNNRKILLTVSMLHKKFRSCGECLLKIIKNAPGSSYLDQLFTCLDYNKFYYRHTLV